LIYNSRKSSYYNNSKLSFIALHSKSDGYQSTLQNNLIISTLLLQIIKSSSSHTPKSTMVKSLHRILYALYYLQCTQILHTFALTEPDLLDLTRNSESAQWPLKAGYPGLHIKNLNEYVSLFSHCLVNIQNYQGIEIIGISSPVYLTRFDVANLEYCFNSPFKYNGYKRIHTSALRWGNNNSKALCTFIYTIHSKIIIYQFAI